MTRFVLSIATVFFFPLEGSAQISGSVALVEKGGVVRKVVEGALVYVDGVEATPARDLSARKVTISSRDKAFTPRVQAVTVGESVTFPNLDDIMHNVFSLSKGNRFDLGLYKSGAKKDFVFENPGLVRVYCNIHPHMSAFVQVLPNPYFTWVQPDGGFNIARVPPGQYTLKVWHEEAQTSQPVVVSEGGASGVLLKLDVSQYKKRSHLNKFGKPYKRKRGKY